MRIRAALPCRNCGYSLKGLLTSAQCPECGRPVTNTLASSIDLQSVYRGPLPRPRCAAISVMAMAIAALTLPVSFTGGTISAAMDVPQQAFDTGQMLVSMKWVGVLGSLVGILGVALFFTSVHRNQFVHRNVLPLTSLAFLGGVFVAGGVPRLGYLAARPEFDIHPAMSCLLLPILAQAILVQLILKSIGQRSFRFLQAGQGLQKASTLAYGILLQILMLSISLAFRGTSGQGETVAEISQIGWIAIGGLNLVGFAYLLVNAAWAVKPILRAEHRLDQLLNSPPDHHQPD